MNENLLQYLLESAAGLTLLYLCYALLLRRETCFQFNRYYLLGSLVLAFLVPLSQLPGLALWPQEPMQQEVVLEPMDMTMVAAQVVVVPEETFNYWNLLYVVYGIGLLFFGLRLVVQLVRLRRFARQRGVSFYLPNLSPVVFTQGQLPTFSFWRYVFFDNSQKLTPEETERILQHEQVHIDQRHTLDVLLVSVVGIVFWFNPLLVLYKKALEQTHEFIADAQVAQTAGSSLYSYLLVKQVFRNADFPLGSYFFLHKSLTLTRIKMMKKLHQSPRLSRMLMAVPALALFLVAVAAMRPAPAPQAAFEKNTKVTNGPAEFPGGKDALERFVKSSFVLPEVAFQKRKSPNDYVRVVGTIEVDVKEDGTAVFGKTLHLEVNPNDAAVTQAVQQQFARLVQQMPKWSPAKKDGRAVASKERISVTSTGGNFLSYGAYLEGRQQKTSVTGKSSAEKSGTTQSAEYPGGKAALYRFLTSQYITPEEVFRNREAADTTAKMVQYIKAELTIGANGKVTDVSTIEVATKPAQPSAITQAIETEVRRVLRQMPAWTPAYKNGAAVASKEAISFASVVNRNAKKTSQKEAAPAKDKDLVFIAVEQMPEFPGGQKAMFDFLKDNFVYPQDAKEAKVTGMVVATFVVNTEGKVTDVQVMKKLHPSLDRAFTQVLLKMPNWKPGTQNGKAVNVRYTVPFRVTSPSAAAPAAPQEDERVFIAVEQMPEFPGGQAALYKYLSSAVGYSAAAKAANAQGMAEVSFVVNKDGAITKVQLLKGVHPSLDQSLMKAIEYMPAWKPGRQNEKNVNVKLVMPFKFVAPAK
ncbi:TonB family protein [Rufibacter immobilis]|uniref:TonB family protein n=1 Tax=Rufibacter immobilis TaxID=1348778 RepID=A0A3M9N538_9BACT|nr:M56 family metallopeptidase [Rufibacter immobilis]RNI32931.1 TonB family protein [Rufibacter immobilis]